jgi:hypothetical protein
VLRIHFAEVNNEAFDINHHCSSVCRFEIPHSNVANCAMLEWGTLSVIGGCPSF